MAHLDCKCSKCSDLSPHWALSPKNIWCGRSCRPAISIHSKIPPACLSVLQRPESWKLHFPDSLTLKSSGCRWGSALDAEDLEDRNEMETIFLLRLLASKAVERWHFSAIATQCPVTRSVDKDRRVARPSGCLILDCNSSWAFLNSPASMTSPESVPSHWEKQQPTRWARSAMFLEFFLQVHLRVPSPHSLIHSVSTEFPVLEHFLLKIAWLFLGLKTKPDITNVCLISCVWMGKNYVHVKERLETLLEKYVSYVRRLLGHGGKESSLFSTSFYADEKICAYITNLYLHILFL